ncbi:hypothetical protein [Caenimonas sp. SL110]|uniref:hypothetical protein n=1 Tax=Caenimonas sp. SL110 TaxID=1450524 RepID=UPI0006546865|nr:hypothetical protein [Caenimonas sp. SL110]
MKKTTSLLVTVVVSGAALAQSLPPVEYVNGAPQCPRDLDIKNMETRLSARIVPADNAAAVRQELAKAAQCRRMGLSYGPDDWKRMNAVTRGDK